MGSMSLEITADNIDEIVGCLVAFTGHTTGVTYKDRKVDLKGLINKLANSKTELLSAIQAQKKLERINLLTLHAGCNGRPDCINCKVQKIINSKEK